MPTEAQSATIQIAALPALGQPLAGGTFAGLVTQSDGTHAAIVLLPEKGKDLSWQKAKAWAEELGAQLPTRPMAALLFANVKSQLTPEWHWTSDEYNASFAWICTFYDGYQFLYHESYEGYAVAVRLIPLTA